MLNGDNMNEENRRKRKTAEMPVNVKLLTVQLFCSLIIILILFFISRSNGGISNNIRDFYGEIRKTDMSVSEVFGAFKNAAKETFAPVEITETEKGEVSGE